MCFVCTVHRQIAQLLRVHMRYLSIQAHICALYGRCVRVDMHTNARIQAQQAYTCACTRLCRCIVRYICGNTQIHEHNRIFACDMCTMYEFIRLLIHLHIHALHMCLYAYICAIYVHYIRVYTCILHAI
jgi:hypothetical protein